MPPIPDLIVQGGGIFGLSVAWEAARRGARVRLHDAARIGAGASGGLVGALAPHMPEAWNPKKQMQLDSLLMAPAWWAEVAQAGGVDPGYLRSGRLQPLADAAAVDQARARAASAAQVWAGRATWQVVPATGAAWEPHSPSGWLIHDTLSARLSPRRAGLALVAAIRARGGEVIEGGVCDLPPGVPVVWATGTAGLLALTADLGRAVGAGVKGQALSLAHAAPDAPQIYVGGLHIVPHADGTVAIGSTSETAWDDPTGTDAQLDAILARVRAAVPSLAEAPVIERWAGVRPRARSRAPMLGPWPGRPGQFIANGGFKIGFGMGPRVAQILVDLVLDGRDAIPPGFRVEDSL